MKKVNDLEVTIGDKTYVIEVKSEQKKLRDKNYKPNEIDLGDGEIGLEEWRNYWEDPSFIKLLTEDANVKKLIMDNFGSLDIAVKEIKKYKPQTPLAKAMVQVRKATQPLKETMDKISMPQEVIDKLANKNIHSIKDLLENHQTEETGFTPPKQHIQFAIDSTKADAKKIGITYEEMCEWNSKGGGINKKTGDRWYLLEDKDFRYGFKWVKLKKLKSTSFLGSLIKERKLTTIPTLDLATHLKGMKANKKAPYDRLPITGTGLKSYMDRQKPPLKSPVDVIKAFKKDKSLKVKSWENLVWFLRQMNYEPDEVFEYALTAVSNTKERWNRHRIFREFEKNESGAIEDICKYYKTHLKSKLPLKSFYGNDFFKDWCINNNVYFGSEENFRQCLKGMVKAFNKKYPKKKIPEKLK